MGGVGGGPLLYIGGRIEFNLVNLQLFLFSDNGYLDLYNGW